MTPPVDLKFPPQAGSEEHMFAGLSEGLVMDERAAAGAAEVLLSPYHRFSRAEWAALRADTPLTLTIDDLTRLRSLNDPISLEEVVAIYLPLSRLLALYVAATQGLYKATQRFLGADGGKTPYIIGIAGSVSVGKSTLARVMQALLSRWPNTPKVDLVTTDGFLHPNAMLESEGLMQKKGFPESYDGTALLRFLSDVKAGRRHVEAPVYSHLTYDVVPGEAIVVDRPDILIVEGLNVLLPNRPAKDGRGLPFVSDFFDFSIYLHAAESDLERWFLGRFMRLRETSFRDPQSYFRKYADLSGAEAEAAARGIWTRINLANLRENLLPTRARASLVLTKGSSHRIEEVELRKL
ncbi:pantothenate kinase [Methylocella tundrae]|uniref:Pantothenate kinase n=2 Tax=Methylocella tundrae TaxID=227605 RepID=A0A8B6MD92_METTU|nr:pantothenate kinase [Methylocella tundrae]VTZ52589.1 pantothenate kinase [Methylocella tundrae]